MVNMQSVPILSSTMKKIYVCFCLLSALTVTELMPLHITGYVGKNVTFICSNWNTLNAVTSHVKYFCNFPCKQDKDIIIKAAVKQTKRNNKIEITNSADSLFVTFINLKKSDSKVYYCGVERLGFDSFIKVNLKVTDVESSSPKTTPNAFAVPNSSTVSTFSPDIMTDMSMSYIIHSTTTTTTSSATIDTGVVPYLIIGIIVTITILLVLLELMRKMAKKQLNRRRVQEDVEYDTIRHEDQQTVRQPAQICSVFYYADPGSLYANLSSHQDTELAAENRDNYSKSASSAGVSSTEVCAESRVTDYQCELVYSVAQLPKVQISPTGYRQTGADSNRNDIIYSMAQLPQAT